MAMLAAMMKDRITRSPRDTGLRYSSGIYSSQLIANYQRIKDYNYSSDAGRYAAGTTTDDMEQRYIQWGNNIEVGHGAISGGVDWKQEKLTSSSTTLSDAYKRDTTGLYLTGQQQIDSVTPKHPDVRIMTSSSDGTVLGRLRQAGSLLMATGLRSLTVPDSGAVTGSAIWRDAFCFVLWAWHCFQPKPEAGRI